MDEREIERVLRDGLEAKAADADVTVPVVARARAEVSRRRRTRWGVGVAAAAAVVLVVGGVAVATGGGDNETKEPASVTSPTATDGVRPADLMTWRTEYWGGLAVDVPADWGYGGAPLRSGGEAVACFPEAAIGPDGSRLRRPGEQGWVGRPIAMTDVCAGYPWIERSPLEEPTAPYVWLGAAVEPGTVEYENGYVQETVEVAGTTVTVGSDDVGLREEILGSARAGHLCSPTLDAIPSPRTGAASDRRGGLVRAAICAYRRDGASDYQLSYAAELDRVAAEEAFAAAERAPVARVDCDYDPFEFVLLDATYNDEFPNDVLDRTAVYEMGCGGSIALDDGPLRELTAEAVEPWSNNGIPAVLYSFIGPQG
jgi:hypothetical protein